MCAADSFFATCDKDRSKSITLDELGRCLFKVKSPLPLLTGSNPAKFMALADLNKDNAISLGEYQLLLEGTKQGDDVVEFKNRHGKVETISSDELFKRMEQGNSRDQIKMVDGKMVAENSGSSESIDKAVRDNPGMGRFIELGKWAREQLNLVNYAKGSMSQLRSLPQGGSVNRGKEDGENSIALSIYGTFSSWLELSTSAPNGKLEYFEVLVERDPIKYKKPYLGLMKAWKLNVHGKRVAELPLPPLNVRLLDPKKFYSIVCCAFFTTFIVWALYRRRRQRNETEQKRE
jgi:hypothetical protein